MARCGGVQIRIITMREKEMRRMKKTVLMCAGAMLASQFCQVNPADAKQVMVDAKLLQQLQQLVADQQKQLNSLQQQVNQFQQTAVAAEAQAQEAKTVAEEAKTTAQTPAPTVVTSGSEKVKLAISGQVDRAMNVIDDGDKTDAYFVDNGASNTRIRFVGTAGINEDLTLGSRLELAFTPNASGNVNQNSQETGDSYDERWADISLASKKYGKLYFGKGSTASDNSAEVDLSGTDVVAYASFADIAGGMLFYDSDTDNLSDIKVSQVFNDFDGLSRKSRVMYETPKFYGFGLAGSAISNRRWDSALTWSGSGYGLKVGAAAAAAYINTDDSNFQYDGSFSALHEATGLNFTFSAGTQDADDSDNPYSLWGKLGWQTNIWSVGKTSFSVDYGYSDNVYAEDYKGDSFGIAAVQSFADYGTELFLQFRQYALDAPGSSDQDLDDMNVATVGARVKF
jgi:hypothetical protein